MLKLQQKGRLLNRRAIIWLDLFLSSIDLEEVGERFDSLGRFRMSLQFSPHSAESRAGRGFPTFNFQFIDVAPRCNFARNI